MAKTKKSKKSSPVAEIVTQVETPKLKRKAERKLAKAAAMEQSEITNGSTDALVSYFHAR